MPVAPAELSALSPEELARLAVDPATSEQHLADLAGHWPELRPLVAANPTAYAGLLEWLSGLGDAGVDAALAARGAVVQAAAVAAPFGTRPAASSFAGAAAAPVAGRPRTPSPDRSMNLTLAWGSHRVRHLTGVALGVASLALLYATLWFYIPVPAIAALLVAAAMVAVLPASGGARVAGSAYIIGAALLLNLSFIGAGLLTYIGLYLSAPAMLAGWLTLRMRPARSFAFLPLPAVGVLAGGNLYFWVEDYAPFVVPIVLVIVCSWLGYLIGRTKRFTAPVDAVARDHDARVEHIRQWEAAYASAHDGALPPAGFVPPMSGGAAGMNTMAVLSILFAGGVLGIIFGHIAKAQIRRTGERGSGLATAGLVIAYILTSSSVAVVATGAIVALAAGH